MQVFVYICFLEAYMYNLWSRYMILASAYCRNKHREIDTVRFILSVSWNLFLTHLTLVISLLFLSCLNNPNLLNWKYTQEWVQYLACGKGVQADTQLNSSSLFSFLSYNCWDSNVWLYKHLDWRLQSHKMFLVSLEICVKMGSQANKPWATL